MSITPFNSVGGYSTGLTGYTVIDAVGGLSAAGATFSGLARFTADISAAGGVTLAGALQGSTATFSGLLTGNAGISAAGGTFSSPISIPKLPHLTSAVFETKTTNWTPTDADDGKIFVVNISGKSTITCTLNGLSVGVSFKIFVQSGTVAFSVTGTGHGSALTLGSISTASSTTIYCTASNVYFGTSSG